MPENDNDQQQTGTDSDDTGQQEAQNTETESDTESEFDWEAEAKKWRAMARKHESAAKANAQKATAWDKAEAANKSELDKLKDELTARDVEINEYRVGEVRRKAALNAGLDVEMAEFITAGDDVEALEQAQKLAKRLNTTSTTARKTGDLRQGSRGENTNSEVSRDDILRTWAGVNQ